MEWLSTEMKGSGICGPKFLTPTRERNFCKPLISTLVLGSYFHSYLNSREKFRRSKKNLGLAHSLGFNCSIYLDS